jgi:hypothetical protein
MILITLLATLFSGCTQDVVKYITPKVPKLKTCKVSKKKISYKIVNGKVCLSKKEYRVLKNTNYRLRVCNELLNEQNMDFNKRFAK